MRICSVFGIVLLYIEPATAAIFTCTYLPHFHREQLTHEYTCQLHSTGQPGEGHGTFFQIRAHHARQRDHLEVEVKVLTEQKEQVTRVVVECGPLESQ